MASREQQPGMKELRTIIVTGASSGIGAYCARALKAEGWRVFATARKPEDIAALEAEGIEAFYLDYREPASVAKLLADVLERSDGKLDALFNNGGLSHPERSRTSPSTAIRQQFEANFFGWHDLTQRVVPVMRRRARPYRPLLVGHGLSAGPYRGAYVATKHALGGLTMCSARRAVRHRHLRRR